MPYALVVDDEPYIQKLLASVFRARKWKCAAVGAAEDALIILESDPVALMVLEFECGTPTGMRFVRTIRRRWPALTLLVMSASISPRPEAVLRAGASAFVRKPFELGEIERLIAGATTRRGVI